MSSDKNTDRNPNREGRKISPTPSIDMLNRKLGISPEPRMLTRCEIELLRKAVQEAAQVTREILAESEEKSEN